MDPQIIIASAAILGTFTTIVGFVLGTRDRKASIASKQATAAADISEAFNRLNDALEQRIESLEKQRTKADDLIARLLSKVEILEDDKAKLIARVKHLENSTT